MTNTYISVVIPAYNEVANFNRGVLQTVADYLSKQPYVFEVLLVNDGSTDKTLLNLKSFAKAHAGFRVIDIPHKGKVGAVTAGIQQAKGEIVLFTDFDQSTPITEVAKVLTAFEEGADVVIGERQNLVQTRSVSRYIKGKAFNLITQAVVLPGIKDTQCGFKAFKNEVAKDLFGRLQITAHTQKGGYMGAFDVELLFLARKLGYKIKPVVINWQDWESRRLSASEPWKMLRDIIKVRLFDLKGGYSGGYPKIKGFNSKHFLPVVLLLVLSIPTFSQNIRTGYFSMHDDLQATRLLIMDKCFQDSQIPCRWSQDLGFGYGYPLFNFYPPMPYYLGEIFRLFSLQTIDIVKVIVILNFIISGLTMYLLAQEFWGRWGGLISGLFFVYAPYHAVDIYVRGAINESWALAWFPLIYWSIYKIVKTGQRQYIPLVAISTALLMLCHNPLLMIFTPTAFVWGGYWLIQTKHYSSIKPLFLGGLWAFGLAAFFTLPVLFEQRYAHVETLVIGYFNYLAHFVDLNQLFISRFWGYGSSQLGPNDGLGFQIGYLHWLLSLMSLFTAWLLKKKRPSLSLMILLMFAVTIVATFMAHQRSSYIWSAIPSLQFLQFPWRFLSLTIFGTSFLAGSIVYIFSDKLLWVRRVALAVLVVAAIFLYKDFFSWNEYYPKLTDSQKFSGKLWQLQITSGIFDYLPIWSPAPPVFAAANDADLLSGNGVVRTVSKNSKLEQFAVTLNKPDILEINTFYFPGWKYYVNDQEVSVDPRENKRLGLPRLHLGPGLYRVEARLTETPIRQAGNILSLFSWAILIVFAVRKIFNHAID